MCQLIISDQKVEYFVMSEQHYHSFRMTLTTRIITNCHEGGLQKTHKNKNKNFPRGYPKKNYFATKVSQKV